MAKQPGLYANIYAKRQRIAAGSGEKMRKPGTQGCAHGKVFPRKRQDGKRRNREEVI